MEKDIQEIKISIAKIETTQQFIKEKVCAIPKCEKEVVKEKIKINRKLIYGVFFGLASIAFAVIKKIY